MDAQYAFCSACDRKVEVVVRPDLSADTEPTVHDLVCLAYGESCTGDMCPLFQIPTEDMRAKFERNRPPAADH